nr:MAG TPA: hypothetical protein [Caudoviricetes sp.]
MDVSLLLFQMTVFVFCTHIDAGSSAEHRSRDCTEQTDGCATESDGLRQRERADSQQNQKNHRSACDCDGEPAVGQTPRREKRGEHTSDRQTGERYRGDQFLPERPLMDQNGAHQHQNERGEQSGCRAEKNRPNRRRALIGFPHMSHPPAEYGYGNLFSKILFYAAEKRLLLCVLCFLRSLNGLGSRSFLAADRPAVDLELGAVARGLDDQRVVLDADNAADKAADGRDLVANRNGVAHLALLLVALALRTDQYEIENDDQYDQRKKLCQERTVVACCGHFIQCHEHCNYTSLCNVI